MICIYKITNPNGRIYIGQSTNHEDRWNSYKKLRCKSQPSLYNSLKKYSPSMHKFEIIEECLPENLDEREIYWGQYHNVLSGKHLNNRLGRGFGSYDSEATKLKKSLCHKGRSNYWLKGKKLSKEQCEKIRINKLGKKHIWNKIRKDKGIKRPIEMYNIISKAVIKAKSIPVLQYDLDGNFIKEWESGKNAAMNLKLGQPNINLCCNNKCKSYKGFIWKFKNKN